MSALAAPAGVVQSAAVTSALGATLSSIPADGNLLIAIGFNARSVLGCAAGWTAIRHVSANYVDAQSCYRIASADTAAETPFSGTAGDTAGTIWEIAGQAASNFIDAQAGAEAGPRTVTLTFAPANSGDLIVGAGATNTKLSGITPAGFIADVSASPAGTTGFSQLSAHELNAASGSQSIAWSFNSTTDTHPVTAEMIAIAGGGGGGITPTPAPTGTPAPTATPSATPPATTPTPLPTPTPIGGSGGGLSILQSALVTGSLSATLRTAPANGDLLVAIGFNAVSAVGCASGWTSIRRVNGNYVDAQSCYRIASGDGTLETPFTGNATKTAGELWEVSGQATAGFIDAHAGSEAGPRSITLTFAPPHSGDLILGASAINTRLAGITPAGFALDASNTPAGSTGFSDLVAHLSGAAAGTQSVTWAYNSSTDTHPVTAEMIAIYGTAAVATPTPAPTQPPVDWLTNAYDLQRTGYNPNESTLGVGNVGSIHALWTSTIGGEIGEPVYASNVNVNGQTINVLYATSGSGQAVAINADTGVRLWTVQMGTSSYMCGTGTFSFGANGTPVIDRSTSRVYMSDGAANVHAFDLSSGTEVAGWPINIASPADHNFIYSALTYNPANHLLYAETSSTCDISPWFGRITAIDATSGSIVSTFFPAQGASGGGIWGFAGASIDPSTNNVYVATGNSDTTGGGSQTAGYSEQVVALTPSLGSVLGSFYAQLPPGSDSDFGATPMLFRPPGCPLLAAAINKSGLFVLYNAASIGSGPVQSIQMSIGTDAGDFVGTPAWNPVTGYVYVGLPATQGIYRPGLAAFSMQLDCTLNPTPVWNAAFGGDGATTSATTLRSPISIANGVVYVNDYATSTAYALNAASGTQLWSAALSGKGVVGPIVVNGRLYTSDISGKITAWSP